MQFTTQSISLYFGLSLCVSIRIPGYNFNVLFERCSQVPDTPILYVFDYLHTASHTNKLFQLPSSSK
jgi:hypothetical protein